MAEEQLISRVKTTSLTVCYRRGDPHLSEKGEDFGESFPRLKLGRRSPRVSFRVTSRRQNLKQPANGRKKTRMVFRANAQKAKRLATIRENPQKDEEHVWGIPASQPSSWTSAYLENGAILSQASAGSKNDTRVNQRIGVVRRFPGVLARAFPVRRVRAS